MKYSNNKSTDNHANAHAFGVYAASSPLSRKIMGFQAGQRERVGLRERFGLLPFELALKGARKAIAGNDETPPTQWGLSSIRVFKPKISFSAWLGICRSDGQVPIYNFFNRNLPPKNAPYSVKVERCRDFQGDQWTYDTHFGTDFAIPVGTPVTTTAPGIVLRVDREFDHGGLKVCIDHGQGLFTTSGHLTRALVTEGEYVRRGQLIGLSGASGIEFVLFFPWVAPHVHLNVWLNGEAIDPFAKDGEVSMWRNHNCPTPFDGQAPLEDANFEPSKWDPAGVQAAIKACRDHTVREKVRSFKSLERQAAEILFHRILSSASFDDFPQLYKTTGERRPCLDLPFRAIDYKGAWLPPSSVKEI